MKTKIIYEDEAILVIQKPAGLATQTGSIGQKDVVSELKKYLAGVQKKPSPYLGVIHRLDQPVEGVLVFGKTQKATAHLTKQLGSNSLNKRYYAVVCGVPQSTEGTLRHFLQKDGQVAVVFSEEERNALQEDRKAQAKEAVLSYKVIKNLTVEGESCSLLDIHIETGRFHQIRAQMAYVGCPLLGDQKYGTAESKTLGEKAMVRNVALCAYHLELKHPVTGKKMDFSVKPKAAVFQN